MKSRGEASMAMSVRADIRNVVQVVEYMESEGHRVTSVSQAVNWGLALLGEILVSNGKVREIASVSEANEVMKERGLWQVSSHKRNFKKLGTAIRFENMRKEGLDPSREASVQESILNRRNAVVGLPDSAIPSGEYISPYEDDYQKAMRMKKEEELAQIAKDKIEGIRRMIAAGNVVSVPDEKATANMTYWEREQKQRDELKELNRDPGEIIEELRMAGKIAEEKE